MKRSPTQREHQVLHLVASEKTTKEIARSLFISNHTAISHRKNLMEKLEVKNSAGLIRRGFELGILSFIPDAKRNPRIQTHNTSTIKSVKLNKTVSHTAYNIILQPYTNNNKS